MHNALLWTLDIIIVQDFCKVQAKLCQRQLLYGQ